MPLPKFFNSVAKLLYQLTISLLSASFNNKYPSGISLKKTISNEYLRKLFFHVLVDNLDHPF